MAMRKYAVALVFLSLSFLFVNASETYASVKNRVFSLQLDLYGIQPALNDSAQVWLFGPYYGGDFQYMLSQQTALMLSVRTGNIYNDSVSTSIFKFNNDRANRRWTVTSVAAGPKFYLNQRKGTTPYFLTKIEMMMWKVETYPDGGRIAVTDKDGNPKDLKATEFGITAGLGIEQLIADRLAFTLGAEFTYLTGIGANFADWVENSRSRAILQFGAGISIHFGSKRKNLSEESESGESETVRITRKVYEEDTNESADSAATSQSQLVPKQDSVVVLPVPVAPPDRDSDSDGVFDKRDKCASTPVGAIVDTSGCPLDSDKDGVFDGLDRCPNSAARELVDSNGCMLDTDNDGIGNSVDQCPETAKGTPVDSLGCPDIAVIFPKRVFHDLFSAGDTKVKADATAPLDSLARLMKLHSKVTATVYGYTDNVGPNDANLQLSQKRANAVRAYLIKVGIGTERVTAIGRGETNFMASNQTRNGRELNRRIEIEFKGK